MAEQVAKKNEVTVTKGELTDPTSVTSVAQPTTIMDTETQMGTSGTFTRAIFEDALDKVIRDEADVADAHAALEEEGEITWEEVKRKHDL